MHYGPRREIIHIHTLHTWGIPMHPPEEDQAGGHPQPYVRTINGRLQHLGIYSANNTLYGCNSRLYCRSGPEA